MHKNWIVKNAAILFWVVSVLCQIGVANAANIDNVEGTLDISDDITLTFNSTGSYIRKQVFIDSDLDSSSGFDTGFDVLIENGFLYEYTGTGGSNWSWNSLGSASGPTGNGQDAVTWVFPATVVGGVLPAAPLLFRLEDAVGITDQTSILQTTSSNAFYPQDDQSLFPNPDRGLYFYTKIESDGNGNYSWSGADAATLRAEGKSLVLLIVDMREELNSASLPSSLLNELDAVLDYLETNGLKAVFRGRYKADEGGCPANPLYEPSNVSTIVDHIEDLAGVLVNHKGAVAYIEAGMIGRWGEWNCSIHDINDPQLALDIVGAWIQEVPDRFVGLRRPRFKADAPFPGAQLPWVSHYNDCFLYDAGHSGTYDAGITMTTVQEYRDYLQGSAAGPGETASVPIGGESCGMDSNYPGSADTYAPDPNLSGEYCAKGELAFRDYRYSYLSAWETHWPTNWIAEGCWDDVQKELAYRFDVERMEIIGTVAPGSLVALELDVYNTGYARRYATRDVNLIFSVGGVIVKRILLSSFDPVQWLPGLSNHAMNFVVPADLALGNYDIGLELPDPDVSGNTLHHIRFANTGWDDVAGVHYFGNIEVVSSPSLFCNNLPVTVDLNLGQNTTPGDDVVLGTPGNDDIRGKAGNDTICGMGGDDFIHGNSGDDWIDGGDGIDNLRGGQGNDIVYAGSGATVGHPSRVFGGKGDDMLYGGPDADDLRGGRGVDRIEGDGGDDEIKGNEDGDILYGQQGNDAISGGLGNDELYGNSGNDDLNGGSGAVDSCDGGNGSGDTADSSCETVTNVP